MIAQELAEYPIFAEGLPYLPPGGEFRFLFDDVINLYGVRAHYPSRYNVGMTYEDSHGQAFGPVQFVLDLRTRWGLLRFDADTAPDDAQSVTPRIPGGREG